MPKIYCLKRVNEDELNQCKDVLKAILQGESGRGRHAKRLSGDSGLYSVRGNGLQAKARVLYRILAKGDILVCGVTLTHDYDKEMRSLASQPSGAQALVEVDFSDGVGGSAEEDDASQSATAAEAAEAEAAESAAFGEGHYHSVSLLDDSVIVFSEEQDKAVALTLPLVIHGSPGSGKTSVLSHMAKNIELPPDGRMLYLTATEELARSAKENYIKSCDLFGKAPGDVLFTTYDVFLRDHTQEGAAAASKDFVGYEHFQAWFGTQPKVSKLKGLSPKDYWASFRLCSMFSDVVDYQKLGAQQCYVPMEQREAIFKLYSGYRNFCVKQRVLCPWVMPFTSLLRYNFGFFDEAQIPSGCAVLSGFESVNFHQVAISVGDHQKIGDCSSLYSRGPAAPDFLGNIFHKKGVVVEKHSLGAGTYRNSEKVMAAVNALIDLKFSLGLTPAVKGSDYYLKSGNGEAGAAKVVFEKDREQVTGVFQDASKSAGIVVIASKEELHEAREKFPKNVVLPPNLAIGLQFPEVICFHMLSGEEAKKAGRLLKKRGSDTPKQRGAEGHRGKEVVDEEAASLETFFNEVITAASRAQDSVTFIEPGLCHARKPLVEPLMQACSGSLQEKKAQVDSTPDEWLKTLLPLLKGVEECKEAARVMRENVPASHPAYMEFFKKYDQILAARSALPQALPKALSKQDKSAPAPVRKLVAPPPAKHDKKKSGDPEPTQTVAATAKANQATIQFILNGILSDFTSARLAVLINLLEKNPGLIREYWVNTTVAFNGETLNMLGHVKNDPIKAQLFTDFATSNEAAAQLIFTEPPVEPYQNSSKKLKPKQISAASSAPTATAEIKEFLIQHMFSNFTRERLEDLFCHCVQIPEFLMGFWVNTLVEIDGNKLSLVGHVMDDYAKAVEFISCLVSIPCTLVSMGLLIALYRRGLWIEKNEHFKDLMCLTLYKKLGSIVKLFPKSDEEKNIFSHDHVMGFTPCTVVARGGHDKLLNTLVDLGADLNRCDLNGFVPVHHAAEKGHVKVLDALQKLGADFNQANRHGMTPACHAVMDDNSAQLTLLVKYGADLNTSKMDDGTTPAHIAAKNGFCGMFYALHCHGANLNIKRTDGSTPACVAAQYGHEKVLETLQKLGADLNQGKSEKGAYPLYIAAQKGHLKSVQFLIRQDCIMNRPVVASAASLIESVRDNPQIAKNMRRKIAERKDEGDIEEEIHLSPKDIAWVMGHEMVVTWLSIIKEQMIHGSSKHSFFLPTKGDNSADALSLPRGKIDPR
jgi:ankyrin repeat protein